MDIFNFKDPEGLKKEIIKGKSKEVIDYLQLISPLMPDPFPENIVSVDTEFEALKRRNIQGVLTSDEYTADSNEITLKIISLIDEVFDFYTIDEFNKGKEILSHFKEGNKYYRKRDWNKSLFHYGKTKNLFNSKFQNLYLDIGTREYGAKMNITLDKHKVIMKKQRAVIDEVSKLKFDEIINSSVFQNTSFKNQIVFNEHSFSFNPIWKGIYKSKVLNRSLIESKVPQSQNINQLVKRNISPENFEKEILPHSKSKKTKTNIGYADFEEIESLDISAVKKVSYHVIDSEIREEVCGDCKGEGRIACSKCEDGKSQCGACDGMKTQNCDECDGSKKRTCSTCKGRETKSCDSCRGTNSQACTKCKGRGRIENHCNKCSNTRKEDCFECDPGGKIPCPNCEGNGYLKCETCKGGGNLTCQMCDGTKGLFSVSYIKTEPVQHNDNFLLRQYMKGDNIERVESILVENLKNHAGYLGAKIELLSFTRNDDYTIEFELEDDVKKVLYQMRKGFGATTSLAYPLLIDERLSYEILPCYSVPYSLIYNTEEKCNLFIPMNVDGSFDLLFEKKPAIESLTSRGSFKIITGRAFSSKKQMLYDDSYKAILLFISIAKKDKKLDIAEIKELSNLVTESVSNFSKKAQLKLFKLLENNAEVVLDKGVYKFSNEEHGLTALKKIENLIVTEKQLPDLSEELESIKKRIINESPLRTSYITNFFRQPLIFIPVFIIIGAIAYGIFRYVLG